MERETKKIYEIIKNIIDLLNQNNAQDWGQYLEKLAQDFREVGTRQEAVRTILNIYKGGMGSFSDLVLHKDYKMLVSENNKLASLKHELYNACLEYCSKFKNEDV